MGDGTDLPLMPGSFKAEWSDSRFWYREVCVVPDDVDANKVASQTEYSLTMLMEEADLPEASSYHTDIRVRPAAGEVIAEIELVPGKPEGMPYAGMGMLCSEMMAQILGNDKEMFESIVQGAIATAGTEKMKTLVMREMFPDTPVPDKD